MNTATSTPLMSAVVESISNGLSHDSDGSIESEKSPAYTRTRATIANSARVAISAPSRYH